MDPEVELGERVEDEYVVRLLFKFDADDPAEAVEMMIGELEESGLRQWHYRVEKVSTGELYFVNGYGIVKRADEIATDRALEDDEEQDDDETVRTDYEDRSCAQEPDEDLTIEEAQEAALAVLDVMKSPERVLAQIQVALCEPRHGWDAVGGSLRVGRGAWVRGSHATTSPPAWTPVDAGWLYVHPDRVHFAGNLKDVTVHFAEIVSVETVDEARSVTGRRVQEAERLLFRYAHGTPTAFVVERMYQLPARLQRLVRGYSRKEVAAMDDWEAWGRRSAR